MEYQGSDPPPLSFAPPSNYPSPPFSFSQPAANLPTQPQLQLNHPPYEEMIRSAVRALNEKDGSSRQKISRYIENEFHVPKSNLHDFELTHHLRQMKTFGQLVLVRHSYMLPVDPPPQPHQTHTSLGPSAPPVQVQPPVGPEVQSSVGPSVAPNPVSNGSKKKPGRPPKLQLQPIVIPPTPTPSPPVGFAAFSPKQSGVPTTSLFGGLAPASYQFSGGSSVSTMGVLTGPSNNASTMVPVTYPLANGVPTMTIASGPMTIVPSMGPVSNPFTSPAPVNNVHATGLVSGSVSLDAGHMTNLPGLVSVSVSTVPTTSPVSMPVSYSGPVYDPVDLAKVGTNEQINQSAGVVGTGLESSAGHLVISAASDPAVALNNDGPLLVVSTGPDSIAPDGPSMVLGKRGRGRPPKINGGIKKLWGKPATFGRRGRRGRPKKFDVPASTISLRPRGRPRKNAGGAVFADAGGAIVAVDGGSFPVANIPLELPDRSFGRPNKDVTDAASLTSEIHLMAYQGLKAKIEHLHTRIKSAVNVIRPRLNETEVVALGALQDLEDITNMDIISVPVNAQSAPAYVQSAPVGDLNPLANVQGAPVADLDAPVNVQDAATANIQTVPSTAEDAQLTFQGTASEAETAELTFQSVAVPQGEQEPPHQS